jgi:hypothetical protein
MILWPGALFYVAYNYIAYTFASPLNVVSELYIALVVIFIPFGLFLRSTVKQNTIAIPRIYSANFAGYYFFSNLCFFVRRQREKKHTNFILRGPHSLYDLCECFFRFAQLNEKKHSHDSLAWSAPARQAF